jgi:hypothetical protein
VGERRERLRVAIGLVAAGLPERRGGVQAGLLGRIAVDGPGSDEGAAPFAGHAGVPFSGGSANPEAFEELVRHFSLRDAELVPARHHVDTHVVSVPLAKPDLDIPRAAAPPVVSAAISRKAHCVAIASTSSTS